MGHEAHEDVVEGGPPPKKSNTVLIVVVAVAVLGFLGVCGIGILATLLMPALLKAKAKANATKCSNTLRHAAVAAIMYAEHQRAYPFVAGEATGEEAFLLLEEKGYLDPQVHMLGCPVHDGAASYEGFVLPLGPDAPSSTPLLWDAEPHPDGFRNVAFVDGSVQRVAEPEMQELLERLRQEVERPR